MVKIIITIDMVEGMGGKLIAKTMEKAIMGSLKPSEAHPAIKSITSRVE